MKDILAFVVIIFLVGSAAYSPIWWKERKFVRALSLNELERKVFHFNSEYFAFLGLNEESVVQFQRLVESRDLTALKAEWKSFEREFRSLERKAGHNDRPLIFDYYGIYDKLVFELARRRSQ